uniref:Uncharacterized protein n=2 Tax=Enterobacteriaceae TaxID=543 RepID=A0A5B8HU59_ECOLX|nr:hypothetical protein [Klebsiella pneumoniae]QCS39946.1 hypothetical protein [Klebsiella pneumoniae]QDX15330.1 hypothetical protein [Escherichia coli]QFX78931.1 hypothetical protein [Escherichia coli]
MNINLKLVIGLDLMERKLNAAINEPTKSTDESPNDFGKNH